jgi:hypothetical protein
MAELDCSGTPLEVFKRGCRRFVEFCLEDAVGYQLLFQRTIPGFVPSEASMATAWQSYRDMAGARSVVRVSGVADRVDQRSAGTQYSMELFDDVTDLGCGERHAEQHVAVRRIEAVGGEGQRIAYVVAESDDSPRFVLLGLDVDRLDRLVGVVEGDHLESLSCEIHRVAPLAGAELEHGS